MKTEAVRFLESAGWNSAHYARSAYMLREKAYRIREKYIAKFGFAILDGRTIETLRPYGPFIEVGAGSGYWSYELRLAGVDSLPTDPGKKLYSVFHEKAHYTDSAEGRWAIGRLGRWKPFMPIEDLDGVAAVKKYPERTLLVVWPDYQDPWAAETLAEFAGSTVAYVGEGEGGCTGDDRFHYLLDQQFSIAETCSIPNFFAIHDALTIYRRGKW